MTPTFMNEPDKLVGHLAREIIIWIADDNPSFLENVIDILEIEPFISAVKGFKTAHQIIHAVRTAETLPDVILMDIRMEYAHSGIVAVKEIRAYAPDVKIIMLTARDDIEAEKLSFEAGANEYLSKHKASDSDLISIIHYVVRGEGKLSFKLAQMAQQQFHKINGLLDLFINSSDQTIQQLGKLIQGTMPKLTETESDILARTIQQPNLTEKELAAIKQISAHTISRHHANIKEKCEVNSKLAVIMELIVRVLKDNIKPS